MKRALSLILLLLGSLTSSDNVIQAQTWCVSSSNRGSRPKISARGDGHAYVVWLESMPAHYDANDVFCGSYDPGTNAWTTGNLTDDWHNQSCCDVKYDQNTGYRWIAIDDSSQISLSFYITSDSSFYTYPIFDTLLPAAGGLFLESSDSGKTFVVWTSDEGSHPWYTGIYMKEIQDTSLGCSEMLFNGSSGGTQNYSTYVKQISVIDGYRPVLLKIGDYGHELGWGSNHEYAFWNVSTGQWEAQVFAYLYYTFHMPAQGYPATSIAIAQDNGGNILVFFARTSGSNSDTLRCFRYDTFNGTCDSSFILQYNTPVHSGAGLTMANPTVAWSDGNNIYLQTLYDTLWSYPPQRVNPTGIDHCINPDIDWGGDSLVWVSYESGGDIYVTRTTIPTGVAGQPEPPAKKQRITLTAYPNPSRGSIRFQRHGSVNSNHTISIYDIAGRRVRSLNNDAWDGRDESGRRAAPGVYFARLASGGEAATIKLTIIK